MLLARNIFVVTAFGCLFDCCVFVSSRKHDVRETISKCKDALQRLDNPDQDTILNDVNSHLVIETKHKFKDVFDYISPEVEEMDSAMSVFEDEMTILAKLYECRSNTDEVCIDG